MTVGQGAGVGGGRAQDKCVKEGDADHPAAERCTANIFESHHGMPVELQAGPTTVTHDSTCFMNVSAVRLWDTTTTASGSSGSTAQSAGVDSRGGFPIAAALPGAAPAPALGPST